MVVKHGRKASTTFGGANSDGSGSNYSTEHSVKLYKGRTAVDGQDGLPAYWTDSARGGTVMDTYPLLATLKAADRFALPTPYSANVSAGASNYRPL